MAIEALSSLTPRRQGLRGMQAKYLPQIRYLWPRFIALSSAIGSPTFISGFVGWIVIRDPSDAWSVRDLFQFQVARPRAEDADRQHHHQHRKGDQAEHARGAVELREEEPDDEAGEHRADAAEGIGEAD